MPMYEINFSYKIPEWGSMTLDATDLDQAEEFAMTEIAEVYPDVVDVSIDGVREIKDGQD